MAEPTQQPAHQHSPDAATARDCRLCATLRHPAQAKNRRAPQDQPAPASGGGQRMSEQTTAVDAEVAKLRLEYRNKGLRENCTGTVRIGLFGNLVGAEVAAEQRIEVGRNGEYVSIRHTFAVACTGFGCTGFGCTDPLNQVSTQDLIFDCDHGDLTDQGRLAARKQAQAHAETCRALPRRAVTR